MSSDTLGLIFCIGIAVCDFAVDDVKESPVIEPESKSSFANYRTPYEQYCDSIREHDPDYFYDVLMETDEFQENYHR